MNTQLQNLIVIIMVAIASAYIFVKAKKRLTAKNTGCGGCGKCGHS